MRSPTIRKPTSTGLITFTPGRMMWTDFSQVTSMSLCLRRLSAVTTRRRPLGGHLVAPTHHQQVWAKLCQVMVAEIAEMCGPCPRRHQMRMRISAVWLTCQSSP